MKKNGFTLIEILGVITLLSLLSIIVIISVSKSLKDSIKTLSSVQIENIKSAAAMWRTDHIELIPDNDYYILSLGELIDSGYIEDVVDFNSDESYDSNILIDIGLDDITINNELKRIDYITNGANQYIDTLFMPNQDTCVEIVAAQVNSGSKAWYGARKVAASSIGNAYGLWSSGSNFLPYYQVQTSSNSVPGFEVNKVYKIYQKKNELYINDELVNTINYTIFSTPVSLTLFAFNNLEAYSSYNTENQVDKRIAQLNLYYFKVWDNDILVRDFIPVENSYGEKMLLERIDNKFYSFLTR